MGQQTSRPSRMDRAGFNRWRSQQARTRAIQQATPNRENGNERSADNMAAMLRMLQAASASETVDGVPVRSISLDGDTFRELLGLQSLQSRQHEVEMTHMLATLRFLYAASKSRILVLADKLSRNETCFTSTDQLLNAPRSVEIPRAESWDFHLGDRVRIKYSMADFKAIQCKTLAIWDPRFRNIHSCEAIVTGRWSPVTIANEISIYTPSRLCCSKIYAGVLEKIPESERQNEDIIWSRWKVNDYVMIKSSIGAEIVKFLQNGIEVIPERYIGRKGRVIGVEGPSILVTFNERTSYHVNSALLSKCPEQSPLEIPERKPRSGFVVGQKVRVTGNIKELIKNQEWCKDWSIGIIKCASKEVIITHIRKYGNLLVRYKCGESLEINPSSLHQKSTPIHNTTSIGSVFKNGDIVKIKSIVNMQTLMRILKAPNDFQNYLSIPAKVTVIDKDLNCVVKYHKQYMAQAAASTVRRATTDEKNEYYRIKLAVKEIQVGSSVCVDVGPPSYVNAVLQDAGFDDDVVTTLTTSSVLVGFNTDGKAVIELANGRKYAIKRKYLTVPEKFNL